MKWSEVLWGFFSNIYCCLLTANLTVCNANFLVRGLQMCKCIQHHNHIVHSINCDVIRKYHTTKAFTKNINKIWSVDECRPAGRIKRRCCGLTADCYFTSAGVRNCVLFQKVMVSCLSNQFHQTNPTVSTPWDPTTKGGWGGGSRSKFCLCT